MFLFVFGNMGGLSVLFCFSIGLCSSRYLRLDLRPVILKLPQSGG